MIVKKQKTYWGTVRMLQLHQHSPRNLLKSMGRYMEFCIRLKGRQWHLGLYQLKPFWNQLAPFGRSGYMYSFDICVLRLEHASNDFKSIGFLCSPIVDDLRFQNFGKQTKASMILGCFSEGVQDHFCTS